MKRILRTSPTATRPADLCDLCDAHVTGRLRRHVGAVDASSLFKTPTSHHVRIGRPRTATSSPLKKKIYIYFFLRFSSTDGVDSHVLRVVLRRNSVQRKDEAGSNNTRITFTFLSAPSKLFPRFSRCRWHGSFPRWQKTV